MEDLSFMMDLSKIGNINGHIDGVEFRGYIEILNSSLEIGKVAGTMTDKEGDSHLHQFELWLKNKDISYGEIIEGEDDEYVECIALPPFFIIKRR